MSEIKQLIKKRISEKPERQDIYDQEFARHKSAMAVLRLRKSKGLTQGELAKLINKPQSTISRIETDDSPANTVTLEEIAKATNTNLKIEFVEV